MQKNNNDMMKLNVMLKSKLLGWDPFQNEMDYETEAVDVLRAVHELDDENKLARKIQSIYEFSFEQVIPLEECKTIAQELLEIKNAAQCEL